MSVHLHCQLFIFQVQKAFHHLQKRNNTISQPSIACLLCREQTKAPAELKLEKITISLKENLLRQLRNCTVIYMQINFTSVNNLFFLLSVTYLQVSHTGCSCDCSLGCLFFPHRSFVAVVLLWIDGDICSPILAQQDANDFCMAFQPSMD